jgi:Domain of unknown function (DUF4062)
MNPAIEDLQAERDAARRAIEEIRLTTPWMFEYSPPASERYDEAYLRKVEQCDVFLLILGKHITRPVETEYALATRHDRCRFVLLKDVESRTLETESFLRFVDRKWRKFKDTAELTQTLIEAITDELVKSFRNYHDLSRSQDQRSVGTLLSDVMYVNCFHEVIT